MSRCGSAASSRSTASRSTLEEGQILGLIGPNGAGKTTLFNCLSRLYTPNRGDILFEGRSLLDRPPHRIAEIGIARTFQNLALFPRQSVLDNVRIGGHAALPQRLSSATRLRLPWVRRQETALERDRLGAARHARSARGGARAARRPAARHAKAGRAGAGAGRAPETAAARRAGRRAQSRGGRRTRRADPAHPRRAAGHACCSSSIT